MIPLLSVLALLCVALVALWQPAWCRWVAVRLLAHADAMDAMRLEREESRYKWEERVSRCDTN